MFRWLIILAACSILLADGLAAARPGPDSNYNTSISGGGGGAITFNWVNGSNTTSNGAIGSFTVGSTNAATTNGTINSGDTLISCVSVEGSGDAGAVTVTGFTQIQTAYGSSQDPHPRRIWCGYKIAGGAETGTYSASWANGATGVTGASWSLMDYSGANGTTPIDTSAQNINTSFGSANMPCASVTPTPTNDMLVCAWLTRGGNGAYTGAAGMTQRFDVGSTTSTVPEILISDKQLASNSPTGTINATQGAAETSMSITIAIQH